MAKLYRAALDDLRKTEMKELKLILDKQECAGLKGVLWALRKKPEDLEPEEQEVLEFLFMCSRDLRIAYALSQCTSAVATGSPIRSVSSAASGWIKEATKLLHIDGTRYWCLHGNSQRTNI